MNIYRTNRRDNKLRKRKQGHQVDNRGIFLIQEIQRKKSQEIKERRKLKEKILDELDFND